VVELDPWGGETDRSVNQRQQPYRYTSYERDGDGVDQALMRSYHGWWARFNEPDPWEGSYDLTDPQSFNRYTYVQNDPVNFVDPTGMLTVGPVNGGQLGVVTVKADAGPDWTALWELWMFGMQMDQRLLPPLIDGPPELPAATPPQNPVEVNKLDEPPINCNQKLLVSLDSDLQVSYGQNARPYFAPDFARAFNAAVSELNRAGIRPRINSAFRTTADQQRMRAGGAGRNPAASLSLHQAGYAVDINGTATQEFQTIRQVMESHGFTWGGRFRHRDPPHFEINPFGTKGTEEYREKLRLAALEAEAFYHKCS
jgi:RHS repeat-associated protein